MLIFHKYQSLIRTKYLIKDAMYKDNFILSLRMLFSINLNPNYYIDWTINISVNLNLKPLLLLQIYDIFM